MVAIVVVVADMAEVSAEETTSMWSAINQGVTSLSPARYVIIDIETGNPSQEYIDNKVANWKPPKNCKLPETIEAKRLEAPAKIKQKGALLDGAPVICCCCKTNDYAFAFSGMSDEVAQIPGWVAVPGSDEITLLKNLQLWLDSVADEGSTLVGHNFKSFDKPKLRNRYIANRLQLPHVLRLGGNNTIDTMKIGSHFSVERFNDQYISLDDLCEILGVEKAKQVVSGADVPGMHERQQYNEILMYCCIDVMATEQCFLLMTGGV